LICKIKELFNGKIARKKLEGVQFSVLIK